MSIAKPITADDLFALAPAERCELVRGELRMMSPAGYDHGRVANRIGKLITIAVDNLELGEVTSAETGFRIEQDPDTVRAPDVGFLRASRVPTGPHPGFFMGAPDLAVEVLSPDDRRGEVQAKIRQWLDAGCASVWLVDPAKETVTVYRASETIVLTVADHLEDPVLPGVRLPVAKFFRR